MNEYASYYSTLRLFSQEKKWQFGVGVFFDTSVKKNTDTKLSPSCSKLFILSHSKLHPVPHHQNYNKYQEYSQQ